MIISDRFARSSAPVGAQFSPDGKWRINRTNRVGGKCMRGLFPSPALRSRYRTREASGRGGGATGREILYCDPANILIAADIAEKGGALQIGKLHRLFGPVPTHAWYDVLDDGRRFLERVPEQQSMETITVIQNWAAALR
jgi:hypothetical protein